MAVTVARPGTEQRVAELCESTLEGMGYRLVRVRYQIQARPANRQRATRKPPKKMIPNSENFGQMQLMIERLDGATLDVEDCAQVHRHVSTLLDIDGPIDHGFQLEVSSPGIRRPLTRNSDFIDYIDFYVDISLSYRQEGRRRVKGLISSVNQETVIIEQDNQETIELSLSAIGEAQLQLTDKLLKAAHKNSRKA